VAKEFRSESDALGKIDVPANALWGASTQRALDNFPISDRQMPTAIITSLALIKKAAAETNCELGLLDEELAEAIVEAASEITLGEHLDQFPLDVYQTGSGTSTNMNANEVIANLANLKLGGKVGDYKPVHPNDHVNMGQSSNDVIPSTLHVATVAIIDQFLTPALYELKDELAQKASEFDGIVKIGRTHLMDAMPVRLGQEFGGWARQISRGIEQLEAALPTMLEIAIGGTAVGTGWGTHPDFAKGVCTLLAEWTDQNFAPAKNHFEALQSRSPCVAISGTVKSIATSLIRIADDIRLLASGPRLGLGEITLPALQPGSSMMPGKINPVIPEMITQVGVQVMANDAAVSIAASYGHLELNTQLPVIASNLIESIDILSNAASVFAEKCIAGITANESACNEGVEKSLALATALASKTGYSKAAEIAKKSQESGRTIREVAKEMNIADEEELNKLLDLKKLTEQS
jgi:fumarate hydratase, class II